MEIARNYSNFTTNGSPNFLGFAPLIQILNRITFLSFSVFSLFCLIYIKLNARSFMKCSRLCHNNIRGILCCILFIIHLCDFGNCILGDGSVLTCLTTVISWVSLQSLYGSLELKSNVKFFIGVISCFLFLCSVAKFLSALLLIKSPNFSINNVNFFVDVCISLLCFLLTILEALTYLTEVKQIRKEEVKEEFQCYLHNSSPWWSKLLFHWLTPLLIKGFREPLELENLGQLPEEECIHHQFKRFVHVYLSLKSSQKVNQFSLWHCYASVYHRCFIIGGVLKLLGDFAGLIGPLCISVIIKYIENLQEPNQRREVLKISSLTFKEFISNGYVMAVAVLLSAVAQGSFSQASTHILNIEGIRLKSALQALIYSKVLRSRKIVEDKSELVKNSLNVTKLVSEDCYNIMSCYWMGHYLWAIPVKISVLITLLYYEIGFSAIVGSFSCILIFTPLLFLIGKMMSSNSKLIMYWSDERMKQTNEVLQGIKLLKLYGWEDNFFYKILEVRDKELHLLNKDSLFWALMTFFTHSSSIFITFVTFGIYTLTETKPLSPSSVFSGLALFNQLTVPLFIFPIIVPIVISALNSTKRIEEFLSMPEVVSSHKKKTGELNSFLDPTMEALNFKQTKVLINTNSNEILANILEINEEGDVEDETFGDSKIENSLDSNVVEAESGKNLSGCEFSILQSKNGLNECSEQQMSYSKTDDSESFVQVQVEPSNGTRLKQSLKTVEKNYREELSVIKSTCDASCEGNNVVEVHDAVLSWGCSNRPQLRISKLFIPKGQLTMIIGNVGSGKTSLLAALLGEMECISGNIEWTAKTSLAYVPQKPWLLNATLRDNILFGRSYHAQRFNRAVAACTLQPDIDILPDKDLTLIGENGITLSGGQQQRITIARAIYSRAEVIILDDPLSALDHKVAKHVFDRGIKRLSTHHNRTVILVTHSLHLLPNSNHVTFNFSISSYLMQRIVFILMDSNQIIMSGNKTDLEHYKNRLLKPEESLKKEFGKRTASERWQLLKLISKVGFQRRRRTESQRMFRSSSNIGSLQFIPFRKRLETFSGSRYFAHDLLLPTDECNQDDKMDWNEFNKWCNFMTKSIHRKIVSRCTSLQADQFNQFSLTIRQSSSPSIQPISARTGLSRHGSTSEHGSLRRKLFAKSSNFNHQSQLEKVLSVEKRNQTLLQRVPSIVSEWSEDFNEDDEFLNGDFCQWGIDPIFEQRTYGNIPWKVYLTYLRECGLMISILFLSVTIFWQSLKVYSDFWLSFYSENTSNQAWIYLCVYAFHSTGCVFLSLASIGLGQYGGALARKELHNQLLFSLMHSRLQFFDITPLGRIINRFSNDISVVDKKIATSMQRLLQFLLLCFSAIIVNCIVSPWFLVAAVPLCVLYYLIQDFYRHSSRELQRLESITRSPILSHLTETSQGIDTIRAFGQENYFFAAFFHKLNVYSNAFIIHNSANRWLGIVLDYLGAVIVFVAITLSLITASLFPSIISPSLVGLAINYTLLVPIYLNWVVKFLADMETHMTAVERISEFISTESENYCPDASPGKGTKSIIFPFAKGPFFGDAIIYPQILLLNLIYFVQAEIPQTWPSKGDIKFENVTVCYDKTKSPAVKSLNLHIFAGQKVGICGRSGSGKTSLIMSLFRIANLTKGTIFIDNVDIYNVPLQKLRSSLAVISQDVIMFSGSIRENLDLYHKYSDEELWKALEMAQLAETVKNLPHNLDGCVKEGGSNFSVGQRQLFCLARSILQNSVCLVMDEATSSLDPGVESELIFAAEKAFIGKTILSVTHRLSSILSYDRIIVLDSGKIVEDGSPSQLLSRPSGYFSLMLRASNETAFSEFEGLP